MCHFFLYDSVIFRPLGLNTLQLLFGYKWSCRFSISESLPVFHSRVCSCKPHVSSRASGPCFGGKFTLAQDNFFVFVGGGGGGNVCLTVTFCFSVHVQIPATEETTFI